MNISFDGGDPLPPADANSFQFVQAQATIWKALLRVGRLVVPL